MLREKSIVYIPAINKKEIGMLLIKGVISTSLLFCSVKNTYAKEAYAMPTYTPQQTLQLPAPEMPKQIPRIDTLFLTYINAQPKDKEPTEEELRKIPLYQPYYFVDDKKEQLEEKITEGVNKSEWKDKANIDKISTKLDNDRVKFKVKFKERNNKQRFFTLEAKPQDAYYEAKLSLKF